MHKVGRQYSCTNGFHVYICIPELLNAIFVPSLLSSIKMYVSDLMVRHLSLWRGIATKEILEANFYLRSGMKSLNVFACCCMAIPKTWYSVFVLNPQLLK